MDERVLATPVSGLICRECEDIFMEKISYVRGVISAECSYLKGQAVIRYDSDILSEEHLKENMDKEGFPAREKTIHGWIYDLFSLAVVALLLFLIRKVSLPVIPRIDNSASYPELFLIGLVTGTHCSVMCGGIMLSRTTESRMEKKHARILPVLFYNTGRVVTASLLGAVFGGLGKKIMFTVKAKSMIFTLTGLYILMTALAVWGVPVLRRIQTSLPSFCSLKKKDNIKYRGPFLAGLLTELLPCASSNSMWLLSVSSGSALKGMMSMLSWSLGTVPCLSLLGLFASVFHRRSRAYAIRINIVLMTALGINMMVMGISLI